MCTLADRKYICILVFIDYSQVMYIGIYICCVCSTSKLSVSASLESRKILRAFCQLNSRDSGLEKLSVLFGLKEEEGF